MNVPENIKLIIEITENVYKLKIGIQNLIDEEDKDLLINIGKLLNRQDIEIDRLRYFTEELIEILIGKGKYLQFIRDNTGDSNPVISGNSGESHLREGGASCLHPLDPRNNVIINEIEE